MGFHNVVFPVDIAYGAECSPSFFTEVVRNEESGKSIRTARRSTPRWRFNAATGVTTRDQFSALLAFIIARQGALFAFPFYNHVDHSSASDGHATPAIDDQLIGVGDGSTTQFQLKKTYTDAGGSVAWNVTLPITGSVRVAIDGVEQLSGWSVNTQTGVVTFTTPPGSGLDVTAGFQFYVPVRFSEGVDRDARISMVAFEAATLPDIEMLEEPDEAGVTDDMPGGGAAYYEDVTEDMYAVLTNGRLIVVNTATSSLAVHLPDPSLQPTGPDIFHVVNIGSASVAVKNFAGTTLATLGTGGRALCGCYVNASSVATWVATT